MGAHADDANTVYVDIRDWYWAASDKDRAEVDQYRVRNTGDFKWWHWNIHARVVFSRNSEYDDERKLKEWEKLSSHEQRLIRQDGELRGKVIGGLTRGVGSKLGQLVAGRAG